MAVRPRQRALYDSRIMGLDLPFGKTKAFFYFLFFPLCLLSSYITFIFVVYLFSSRRVDTLYFSSSHTYSFSLSDIRRTR